MVKAFARRVGNNGQKAWRPSVQPEWRLRQAGTWLEVARRDGDTGGLFYVVECMRLPLVYHDDYSPPFPANHRFPMEKFRLLRDHLVASGLTTDAELIRPDICPADILALAHDPTYIERFLSGELAHDEQRRLGLPWSEALARRTVRAVGGSILTAELALQHGLACHLAGGTHHAHYDHAAGFCIFNDLAIISRYLLEAGRVGRVLIFDCDVHQGDGTARILADTPDAITVSLHCEKNFPARKAHSDWDIPLPMGMEDDAYLKAVDDALNYLLPLYQPDLVLYDAGVDVHKDDALGYLKLTDAGVAERDERVIRHCLGRDIPVMGVIGGGYDNDRAALARRHGILHHSADRVWNSQNPRTTKIPTVPRIKKAKTRCTTEKNSTPGPT